ncbi:UNVERIFIED_CONTAM: hypothetical protein RMT77_001940 [Armadillidium vulgare]
MATNMVEALYSCEVCGQDGLTDEELRKHMLYSHLDGSNACPFCDLSDVSAEEMIIHVNCAHLDYLSPQDEELSESFVVTNGFGDHMIVDGPPPQKSKKLSTVVNNMVDFIPVITIANEDMMNANVLGECKNKNLSNPSSPSRNHLSLNLKQKEKKNSMKFSNKDHITASDLQKVTQCPICNIKERSPTLMQEHVNRAHFDLTSPSFPRMSPEEGIITFSCPLCLKHFETTPDLELHVNIAHKDILSPAKSNAGTPANSDTEIGTCPVCGRSGFPSYTELALHIDTHFSKKPSIGKSVAIEGALLDNCLPCDLENKEKEVEKMREQQEFSLLRAQYGMDNEGNFSQQSISNMQRAVYAGEMSVSDYYERKIELKVAEQNGVDDGRSCTKGLLGPIRTLSEASNGVKSVWLCSTVDHYASTYGDRGWGCGYRNIQMLLSCLQHHTGYYNRLFSAPDSMPSISQIQKLIEKAWRSGFDLQGCEQLGGRLSNTRKWIGATEVFTLLSSFRIRCQLIDYHRPTGPDGTHPELFRWCLEYFSKPSEFKPPIYLQHQGHSRTIIGVEQLNGESGVRLLVFDPSHSPTQMSQLSHTQTAVGGMRLLRKNLNSMKARQYQMVVVTGIIETEQEYKKSKELHSIKVPKD